MGAPLILVGLLYLCGLSFGQECVRKRLQNVDFKGNDIRTLYSPDAHYCQLLCTHHPTCQFFTFVRADSTRDNRNFHCYLRSTASGQPNTMTALQGVTSGYSLKHCNPYPSTCLSLVYQNMDLVGTEQNDSLYTADYQECQRTCNLHPSCQSVVWGNGQFELESERYKCLLKFSQAVPGPKITATGGLVSGFSYNPPAAKPFCPACPANSFPSNDIPTTDLGTLLVESGEECLSLCSADPRCTHIFFERVNGSSSDKLTCYLKNQPLTIPKGGVPSDVPPCFCQHDNSWMAVINKGVHVLLDNAETCQKTCTEDPNCDHFTYVTNLFPDPALRRRCYLSRTTTLPLIRVIFKLNNAVSGLSLKNC